MDRKKIPKNVTHFDLTNFDSFKVQMHIARNEPPSGLNYKVYFLTDYNITILEPHQP